MAFGLQLCLLGLDAAGVLGVQLAAGLQGPPVGGLVSGALGAGPCGDGYKNARRDGVGEVGPAGPRQIGPDLAQGDHLAPGDRFHQMVVGQGRGKVHFVAAVFLDGRRVGDPLDPGHPVVFVQHGVEIFRFFVRHFRHLLLLG